MRQLVFLTLSVLLIASLLCLYLVHMDIGQCDDSFTVSALVATIISTIPPMFYRSEGARKLVLNVHIASVTVAAHFLSTVWAGVYYKQCKGVKDTTLSFASIAVVSFALTTVVGHMLKGKGKEYEAMGREDI